MTAMDSANPAVTAQTRIPPALLEAVADDPAVGRRMFRKMMMVQADKLHRLSLDPNTATSLRLQIAEWFSKNADFAPKALAANASAGPTFSININMDKKKELPMVEVVGSADPAPASESRELVE